MPEGIKLSNQLYPATAAQILSQAEYIHDSNWNNEQWSTNTEIGPLNGNRKDQQSINAKLLDKANGLSTDISDILSSIQDIYTKIGTCVNAQGADDLCTQITNIRLLLGDSSSEGSLVDRLEELEQELPKCAHLDEDLRLQGINKLKGEEYPVTSAYFYDGPANFRTILGRLTYNQQDIDETQKYVDKVYVYFPEGSIIGQQDRSGISKFDFNDNNILDFGDLALLLDYILNPSKYSNTNINFDVNNNGHGDGAVNLSDINQWIDKYLKASPSTYQNYLVDNECTKYIYEISLDPTIIQSQNQLNSSNQLDQIESLLITYKVNKHKLISGKVYTNLTNYKIYRYNGEKPNKGIMEPLTQEFSAKLDSKVLDQIPDNLKQLNFDNPNTLQRQQQLQNYFTLEAGQYPPTTIDILTPVQYYRYLDEETGEFSRSKVERIEYLGYFDVEVGIGEFSPYYDIYPLGHIEQSYGKYLYYQDSYGNYKALKDNNGNHLKAGNNLLSIKDSNIYNQLGPYTYDGGISSNGYSPQQEASRRRYLFDLFEIEPNSSYNCERLFFKEVIDGEETYISLYNDPGISSAIIDHILNNIESSFVERQGAYGPEIFNIVTQDVYDQLGNFLYNQQDVGSISLPNQYHEDIKLGWLVYYFLDENDEIQEVMYPCIEGKLYSDYYTGNLYYYTNGHMVPVQKNVLLPGTGLRKNNLLKYSVPEGTKGYGPYFETTISLSDATVSNLQSIYSSGSFGSFNEAKAYIKEEYITLPFKWLLYDNGQFEMLQYVPEPTLDIATMSEDPKTTIGEFQKVSNGTTYERPITYGDISS